jgi:hypothetical protein
VALRRIASSIASLGRTKPTKREIAAQHKAAGANLKAIEDKIKTLAK